MCYDLPMEFRRSIVNDLDLAVRDARPFLNIILGPRQVGKTTAVEHLLERVTLPYHMVSADSALSRAPEWITAEWATARAKAGNGRGILVFDEIQKVIGWSEEIKRLWDKERKHKAPLTVILLGSSSLMVGRGMSESLAGRFILHRCMHWSFAECRQAFGWDLDTWLYYGGYPGAASLIGEHRLWSEYISDSLIETVIGRDILQLNTVTKPALLRNLFGLSTTFPAQVVSYNKMLGSLNDAGNTTTLAGYVRLLEGAYLLSGLELFSRGSIRKRGSSPKLVLWNNALINALSGKNFEQSKADKSWWGRLFENACIAHLLNSVHGPEWSFSYWRDGDREVDVVISRGDEIWPIEIKSGRSGKLSGLEAFIKKYPKSKPIVLGPESLQPEKFLSERGERWLT